MHPIGVFDRFAYKKGVFCKQLFSFLSGVGLGQEKIALKKGKFVFQKSLFKTPFRLDRVSFCNPKKVLIKSAGKNNRINFLWPKMGLGPRFWAQKYPRKSLCGSLFGVLSQEMRHINLLSGGAKWGLLGGAQKVYVEQVHVLLPSSKNAPKTSV